MTVMNDSSNTPRVEFPSFGEKSVRDDSPRCSQQSVRGKQVLDRLLTILSSNLDSQPTSNVSPFPPSLLLTICDALQQGRADDPGSIEHNDASALPSVLSKLRDWRLLDLAYRHSSEGIQNLALDLAGIIDEPLTSADHPRAESHRRLRMKWVSSESPVESQDRESPPPSPSCVLDETQEWAHIHPLASERSADVVLDSCQADGLGVLDLEHPGALISGRHRSVSGYRSGCAACRHRVSSPSTPRTPQVASPEHKALSGDRGLSEASITPSFRRPKSISQNNTTKSTPRKTKREKPKPLQSISHVEVDENEPPLPKLATIDQPIGISFPRHRPRVHSPPISNSISLASRASSSTSSTSSPVTSTKGILQPSHVPNRTREDDKRTFSHRIPSVNVDLRLPLETTRASPIDLQLRPPTRAQSLSYTLPIGDHRIRPHASDSGRVDKVSLNPNSSTSRRETGAGSGSRSSKRSERLLPFWNQPHLTMPSKPASSSSSSLLRSANKTPPVPSTRTSTGSSNSSTRTTTRTKTPSDAKGRRSVSFRIPEPISISIPSPSRSVMKFPLPPLHSRKVVA